MLRGDADGGTRDEGADDLTNRQIEDEGGELQHVDRGVEAETLGDGDLRRADGTVLHDQTLRRARTTGGEEDVDGVAGGDLDSRAGDAVGPVGGGELGVGGRGDLDDGVDHGGDEIDVGGGDQGEGSLGLGDELLEALLGVSGVEGNPGTTGLVDGQDGDKVPQRLLEADVDEVADLDAVLVDEEVAEAVGSLVELGVGHATVVRANGDGVGLNTGLLGDHGVEGGVHDLGDVNLVEGFGLLEIPLGGDVEVGKGLALILGDELGDDMLELVAERLHLVLAEHVGVVDELQVDVSVGDMTLDDERVTEVALHGLVDADLVVDAEEELLAGVRGLVVATEHLLEGLQDEQRGELAGVLGLGAEPGDVLHAVLLVGDHLGRLALDTAQEGRDGALALEADADGHRGHHGTGHVGETGDGGVATRDGSAKRHVVRVAVTGEHGSPGSTEHRGLGDGGVGRAGEVEALHHDTSAATRPDLGRGREAGLPGAGELLRPERLGRGAVDLGDVADEARVRLEAEALRARVGGVERAHEQTQRPTVVDGVVGDPGKVRLARWLGDESVPIEAGTVRHLERLGIVEILDQVSRVLLVPVGVVGHDGLDALVVDEHDTGSQVGAQLEGALPGSAELDHVEVGR